MPECACRFNGDYMTDAHRRHHRAWVAEQIETGEQVPSSPTDLVDIYVILGELVAAAHDPSFKPQMIPVAQAVLFRHTQETK